jgi:UDPglucose 6-dehydrogenase
MASDQHNEPRIGFIGQGFIGKNMADDFERRGHDIVRYALEEPYNKNRDAVATCDIVFIAVPTPTTQEGFSDAALRGVLPLVGNGKIAVVKSTIVPGTTEDFQEQFPDIIVLHSPEFLREKQAMEDTRWPGRNIVGMPKKTKQHRDAAELVLSVLPPAPYQLTCHSREAELVKYGGNIMLAAKVVFMNTLYDLAAVHGVDYNVVADAMANDTRIGASHMKVVDESGHPGAKKGRGAGGHCFPKDLAALREHAELTLGTDTRAHRFLESIEDANLSLLCETDKDMELLHDIFSDEQLAQHTPKSTKRVAQKRSTPKKK